MTAIHMLMLLCWNAYLVVYNKTTIEYHEGVTAKFQVCCSHPSFDLCLRAFALTMAGISWSQGCVAGLLHPAHVASASHFQPNARSGDDHLIGSVRLACDARDG